MKMSDFYSENMSLIYPVRFQTVDEEEGWSVEEEKMFENALAYMDLNSSDILEKMSEILPGKTIDQVKIHFDELVNDLKLIESGVHTPPPPPPHNLKPAKKKKMTCGPCFINKEMITTSSNLHQHPPKKGARWTKDEHQRFVVGLNKYGKGDWRNISRNCVLTKTPTQVASHAQKYFIRLAKSTAATTSAGHHYRNPEAAT